MRLTYDANADMAYIYLADIGPGAVSRSEPGSPVTLDYDKDGRIIGIEIFDAKSRLPLDLLARADRL